MHPFPERERNAGNQFREVEREHKQVRFDAIFINSSVINIQDIIEERSASNHNEDNA